MPNGVALLFARKRSAIARPLAIASIPYAGYWPDKKCPLCNGHAANRNYCPRAECSCACALNWSSPASMESSRPESASGVEIGLSTDALLGGLIQVSARSLRPFTLVIAGGEPLRVTTGDPDPSHGLRGVAENGRYALDFEAVGLLCPSQLNGEPVRGRIQRHAHYGPRFFPFVARHLRGSVECLEGIQLFIVTMPNPVRPVWSRMSVTANDGLAGKVKLALDTPVSDGWRHYWRPAVATPTRIDFSIPLSYAGAALSRAVSLPLLYWLLALAATATASRLGDPPLVLGIAFAGALFMLSQWSVSERPHRFSMLTAIYFVLGALLLGWTAAWLLLGWWAAVLIPIAGVIAAALSVTAYRFTRTGKLPDRVAHAWASCLNALRRWLVRTRLRER